MSSPTSARQQEIVDAVRRSINEFGIRRVTMADIARSAGVSRQTLYDNFPGRDVLVDAALQHGATDLVDRASQAADRAGGAPAERVEAAVLHTLRFFRRSPLWASEDKRAELVPHVTTGGSVFVDAGAHRLVEALASWYPDVPRAHHAAVADVAIRTLIMHGLQPSTAAKDRTTAASLALVLHAAMEGVPGQA